ncbi:MAG: transcriptional regulator [Methylothermaceae bacteria B42]|nr:MAG: transcriptional regulator [Methylothermaceae bacteria B42]HHJ39044.1 AAA family ATPase [Methylothermaceae bacterium]
MNNTVVSILGQRLDNAGYGQKRWLRWRPTLSLLMHHEFPVDELVLIHHREEQRLADLTMNDVLHICPGLKVTPYVTDFHDPWDFEQVYGQLHDFAHDYPFDPERRQYYFHITTGTHVAQICVYLLTEANYFPGKLIQTAPSKTGPDGVYQIIDLDLSRYDKIASRFRREEQEAIRHLKSGIETRNRGYNQMITEIEQVAVRSTAPIFLTGPTGVGKSHLARKIYELKRQRGQLTGRFVEVNCATLRGDNAMSTLFGHVKGAYTGAARDRAGLLMEADGGLLFLDEIGELGLDEQAMLLRAIEDRVFTPLGSDREVSSHFQLIAGTNRDLQERISQGLFREDLLARINLWRYSLPSLRERSEDIEPNIEFELQRFARERNQKVSFNRAAKAKYLAFALSNEALWRANFRDLNASITRMATLATSGRISEEIVENELARLRADWQGGVRLDEDFDSLGALLKKDVYEQLDLFERLQLAQVIRICQQSHSLADAGRKLFDKSRLRRKAGNDSQRLRAYLQKYGLVFKDLQLS